MTRLIEVRDIPLLFDKQLIFPGQIKNALAEVDGGIFMAALSM